VQLTTGTFYLARVSQEYHFDTTASPISALNVLLPGSALKGLLVGNLVTGTAGSAPLRMLTAHVSMIQQNLPDLGRTGRQSAANALVELLKGVALSRFDDQEPALAPILVRAAEDLAEQLLEDPDLSPELIAAALHVSLRTLQRSFATTTESLSAYIRRRRLAEASRMLLVARPPSISEVASRWHFSDSSHFVRTFKQQHGCTPSQYIRRHRPSRS
jgi:AraC-like DNA-binding protein